MARDLLAQDSVTATLERITVSATELVDGCDAAGILVLHDSHVETLAPTHRWSSTATSCKNGLARDRALMPPTPSMASGCSASPISPGSSGGGLRTLPWPASSA